MKKYILILTAILFLFASCDERRLCLGKIPKDVKPIDWDNYNDVYTVYWNTYSSCKEISNEQRDIMMYGWVNIVAKERFQWENWLHAGISVVDNPNHYDRNKGNTLPNGTWISIEVHFPVDELQVKLDSCDLTQKCYVKGKLSFNREQAGICCVARPIIIVENIDDFFIK